MDKKLCLYQWYIYKKKKLSVLSVAEQESHKWEHFSWDDKFPRIIPESSSWLSLMKSRDYLTALYNYNCQVRVFSKENS